jgi:glycosyltransferase involved in cell wall biosynthesis
MDILVITANPDRASFRQRIEIHMEYLDSQGIRCEIVKVTKSMPLRRRIFKLAAEVDGVLLHKKLLSWIDAAWLRKYSKKVIYDFDDAVMYDPELPNRPSRRRLARFRRMSRLADLMIAGNSYLAEHAIRFAKRVEILPTGLDTRAYNVQPRRETGGPIRLVWIGSQNTLKYLIGIKPAIEVIGERFRDVILRVISDRFFDVGKMPVEKRLWSLQTEVIDLVTSDIGLAPLPDDPFTRGKCGFKIIQYAAAGLPVVASPVGVNAEYINDGVTGFHAADMAGWIDKVGRLIQDRQLRERMGTAARASVQRFDRDTVGLNLCNIIKTVVQNGRNERQ